MCMVHFQQLKGAHNGQTANFFAISVMRHTSPQLPRPPWWTLTENQGVTEYFSERIKIMNSCRLKFTEKRIILKKVFLWFSYSNR